MKVELSIREFIKENEISVQRLHKCPTIYLEEPILKNDFECKELIDKELDDSFVLLDLGISLIIEIHKMCKENAIGDKDKFAYTILTAKMVSQLLSIRKLLYSGLMDGVKCLIRPFQETSKIFFACMINQKFATQYANTDKSYDNKKFWDANIKGTHLDKYMVQIFKTIAFPDKAKGYYFSRLESSKNFLSEAIHSSFNATVVTLFMTTIDWKFSENLWGKVTTAYPKIILDLLTDIMLLNTIFFKCLEEGHSSAFEKTDFVGEKYFTYNYFRTTFEMTYNLYYDDLQQRVLDIMNELKEATESMKK
ncbi:hypothetical protein LL037_21485 [Clostridium estertheticum]|uniref:hypothetical protein n=1 Tax=Clostridium estertheticum TaxID=238834 RepID=UPI001C0A9EA4|nr:hypothetical protein [Clostridium estertheticum]MBU3198316.1 hypothetical protein [Clostridium estertheticum]WAG65003.1 hypothetical protein LL037_21485 [Clostridium estertheticum]